MSESILTFAKIIVGGAGLWLTGGAGLATASAVLGLAEDATKLRDALGAAGLHDVKKRLTAQVANIRRDLEDRGDFRSEALADAEALFAQALPHCLPNPAIMVEHNLDPAEVAGWMLDQIASSPVARDFREAQDAERYLLAVTVPVLKALVDDKEFREVKLRTLIDQRNLRLQKETNELVQGLDASLLEQLKIAGANEGVVVELARRIAPHVNKFDDALRELRNAIGIYLEILARPVATNTGDVVGQVLARVRELSAMGMLDDGRAEIARALASEEEDDRDRRALSVQRRMILLSAGIEIDILRHDARAVARAEAKKIELESPAPAERFAGLRAVQDIYYERGRDQGVNLDLEIAIELARILLAASHGPDQRGAALIDLAVALRALGDRSNNDGLLREAVAAYREALTEYTRDRVSLHWATTQNNLGNSLAALGDRSNNDGLLRESVAAYREALTERTRDRVPLLWAMTQNNLGTALAALGRRSNNDGLLRESVAAYREALTERTRDRVPLLWAATQNNLGTALHSLGGRSNNDGLLRESVASLREALTEYTRDRVPLDWAMTQNNLGAALRALGDRSNNDGLLRESVAAYREALTEYTSDRVPLDRATTQNNLAIVHLARFRLTADPANWRAARDANALALDLLRTANAPAYLTKADATLAAILAARPTGEPK